MPTLDLRFINYIITYFVGSTYKTCHLKLKLSLLQQLTLIHFLCSSLLCWAVCISKLFKTRSNSVEGKQRFRCIEKVRCHYWESHIHMGGKFQVSHLTWSHCNDTFYRSWCLLYCLLRCHKPTIWRFLTDVAGHSAQ